MDDFFGVLLTIVFVCIAIASKKKKLERAAQEDNKKSAPRTFASEARNNRAVKRARTHAEEQKAHRQSDMELFGNLTGGNITEKKEQVRQKQEEVAHCQNDEGHQDIPVSEIFGSVEDLIVCGFDGKMKYERDFLGEAQDMLDSFIY